MLSSWPIDIGYANVPYGDERCSGDGWIYWHNQQATRILLVDAMGHGQRAYEISEFIKKQFHWICRRSTRINSISDCLHDIHKQLDQRPVEWQAAAGLVDINNTTGLVEALVIGNVQINAFDGTEHSTAPLLHGMLGGRMPATTPLTVIKPASNREGLICIHSDGIKTTSTREFLRVLRSRPGCADMSAQWIADEVITRFRKTTDDASCLIVRWSQTEFATKLP